MNPFENVLKVVDFFPKKVYRLTYAQIIIYNFRVVINHMTLFTYPRLRTPSTYLKVLQLNRAMLNLLGVEWVSEGILLRRLNLALEVLVPSLFSLPLDSIRLDGQNL